MHTGETLMQNAALSDGQLLSDFVRFGDQGAFHGLVSRHGPTVLHVCRGVLHDRHEAEDAFQATFLVLVRKAPALKNPDAVGGWLRGVAYRTALRARCRAARRREFEKASATVSESGDFPGEIGPDVRWLLREELDRLPDDYRQAVRLCYLEGLTHQEAARKLGWPLGTVKVRLVRGRQLLRERLDRRGVSLGAAVLLWLWEAGEAKAVSPTLASSTARAMKLAAAGRKTTVAQQFPRAVELADAATANTIRQTVTGVWRFLAIAALFLGLAGVSLFATNRPLVPDVDPSTLPSNLTNVLAVDCG
jgi:RNA polymerase sigma factor (sigma-70 family)